MMLHPSSLHPSLVNAMTNRFSPRRLVNWVHLCIFCLSALQTWYAIWILAYMFFPPHETAFMRAERLRLASEAPKITMQYQWVDKEKITPYIKQAVIASEDAFFFNHQGIMPEAMIAGFQRFLDRKSDPTSKKRILGGSTITQQLAKNLFLSPDRSLVRKFNEMMITIQLETFLSKHRILELYLNVAEWGEGIFGIEAAAQHYFSVSASRLTPSQSAQLAAMLPRPRFYQKNLGSRSLQRRRATLVKYLPGIIIPEE